MAAGHVPAKVHKQDSVLRVEAFHGIEQFLVADFRQEHEFRAVFISGHDFSHASAQGLPEWVGSRDYVQFLETGLQVKNQVDRP